MFRQYITLVSIISIVITTFQNDELQGEFNLLVKNIRRFKCPKRKDCCVVTTQFRPSRLLYSIQAEQDVEIDTCKIIIERDGKLLTKLQTKKTCNHMFIGPVLREIWNISKDCIIKKGNHTTNINLENLVRTFNGGIFPYGNITFKYIFHNDACNFLCEIMDVVVIPKYKSV